MIDNDIQLALRAQFNPDGSNLRNLQLHLLDILVEFDRICRKNNISYWLDSGTLLGAARHGGFIPWDDDLDVCVLKRDQKRLARAIKNDLQEPFSFVDANSSKDYTRRWGRLYNNTVTVTRMAPDPKVKGGTMKREESIWLDIFFEANGVPAVSRKIDLFYGRCYRRRYSLIQDGWFRHVTGVLIYPLAELTIAAARLFGRVFHRNSLIHDYGTGFYSQRFMNDVFPLSETEFEGHSFKVPFNTDHYLSVIYGKWDSIPDKKENHRLLDIVVKR